MRKWYAKLVVITIVACVFEINTIAQSQAVQNVTFRATQSNAIEVLYNFSPVTEVAIYEVQLYISSDGGDSYFTPRTMQGDVGNVSRSGSKRIIWNVFSDVDNFEGEQCVVKITAERIRTMEERASNISDFFFSASYETEDYVGKDGFHIGFMSTGFENNDFENAVNDSIIKRIFGLELGGKFYDLPFTGDLNCFLYLFEVPAQNFYHPFLPKDSTVSIIHVGLNYSYSVNIFPSLKYVVPSVGLGYQLSSLITGNLLSSSTKDTGSIAVTSSLFVTVGFAFNIWENIALGIDYRAAIATNNTGLKQLFVLEKRKWNQAYFYILFR
jgi:hypothetical protein